MRHAVALIVIAAGLASKFPEASPVITLALICLAAARIGSALVDKGD